jgi:hypothetical protein
VHLQEAPDPLLLLPVLKDTYYLQLMKPAHGQVTPLRIAGVMGLDYLNLLFFLTLALMLATFFNGRGPVLGICNGFQILCESGLLPGVLMRNSSLKFLCQDVLIEVQGKETPVTRGLSGEKLRMPVAHAEGGVVRPGLRVLAGPEDIPEVGGPLSSASHR